MTAKEWLKEEELSNPKIGGSHPADDIFQGYDCNVVMERYANYKSRELQVAIFEFRKIFTDIDSNIDYDMWPEVFLETYDKHFGIEKI